MKTLNVILRKEFRQFFGNSFLPKLCIMFPIMVMLVMPLVTNMEVKHVGVVMVVNEHNTFSRNVASTIDASTYTSLVAETLSYQDALKIVERGEGDVILEIGESEDSRQPAPMSLSANAVNATKGSLGMQYVQQMLLKELGEQAAVRGQRSASVMAAGPASVINLFNPTLDYRFFMIPALMIMLLVMLCGFLPALNIVGEKERGTIEQINVSPMSQLTFTLGKVIPYWIIGFFVVSVAMLIAWLVYGLSPAGSLITIYLATFLFIIVMSSMAVIFANFSDNMQQVMLVIFFFVMVFILMSGLMTPISSMPEWAQNVTYAIPACYYVDVMRATYLRGTSLIDQWQPLVALAGFAALFSLTAIVTYKKQS